MSLKSLLRLAQDYLRKHPSPTSAQILKSLLKLTYTYSCPSTNSKSKKQILYPLTNINININQSLSLEIITPGLNYDEKGNKLEVGNSFDSISTEEMHQKVLQDPNFGTARLNKNKDKWIYAAKKKNPKAKSYFLGGSGKSVYSPDLGQLYDDISQVGIFIWDLKAKKIVPIDIKIEGDQNRYIFSNPVWANDEGTKFICHGIRKTQFGHGISYCFNRPVQIFETTIQKLGQENQKITSKKLITKHETNIFANISPCYNYILYFGGSDYIHSYYLDLVVLKRRQPNENQHDQPKNKEKNAGQGYGYHGQWKQVHRVKEAFIGYAARSEMVMRAGIPHAYYQTTENSEQRIKCINLETGIVTQISDNKIGQSYSISCYEPSQGLITGNFTSHAYNSFFYLQVQDGKVTTLPPLAKQQFLVQQLKDPIHGYYLESQTIDPEFTKKSQQKQKQKKPLVVIVHGGPHGHADPCLTLFKYMLLKCGYCILMPNFSGSSGFGQEYMKAAVGNVGKKDADQIIGLLEKILKQKSYIDAGRVYVYGGSYGGFMAAIMGSRYDKYFKGAVILNGVISIPGNFWFSDIPEWSTAQTLFSPKIHNLTGQDYLHMYQQSPITQPMKIPTLQFLGAKDRRVPYRQGLLFDAMTRKAGTPIQTFVYENAAHSLADSVETSMDVIVKSMMFLEGIPIREIKEEKGGDKDKTKQNEKENQKSEEKKEEKAVESINKEQQSQQQKTVPKQI